MKPGFIQSLSELVRLLPQIRELTQRQSAIQKAIVTDDQDPTGLRRIRVTREAQGGQSQSDWISCGRSTSFTDEPIPPVGTQCLISLVNGNPHDIWFLRTCSDATNPPDEGQLDPVKDSTTKIPGNEHRIVEGNVLEEALKEKEEIVKEDCYLTVKGKKLHINAELGQILIDALNPAVGQVKVSADLLASLQSNTETNVGSKVVTNISSLIDVLITAGTSVVITQGGAYVEMKNGAWEFGSESGQSWSFGDGEWVWDCAGNPINIINASDVKINGKSIAVLDALDSDGDYLVNKGY